MDLTLGTLAELKGHLLNVSLGSNTDYDAAIAALGRGVAGRLQRACNREFARVEGAVYDFPADRLHVVLPSYPVETITKIELRATLAEGWVDQGTPSALISNLSEKSGLVEFASPLGSRGQRARITYTGGFWIDLSGDGSIAGARSYQDDTVALALNTASLAIVFPSAFAAPPKVTATIIPPAGGVIITAVPSVITAAGFTALIGFPIPAVGYGLQWTAAAEGAPTVPESALPAGATGRPDDLYLAWLLQCERIWSVRDKLGISIGGQQAVTFVSQTLAALELVPEVQATVRNYTRHTLT